MAPSLVNLDLNLLVTLDAVLTERNVTRAAARLGVTQPAVSGSLAKLRRHFQDELLIRQGNRYELTPLAVQLVPATSTALASVRRVFDATPQFDPETATREFTLLLSDYATTVLGEPLSRACEEAAPGIRLRLEPTTNPVVDAAAEALRNVDGLVLPHGYLTDLPHVDLYTDGWVAIVSNDNDAVGDEITREQLAELPWVLTYHSPTAFTPADKHLRMIGIEPRASIIIEGFLAVPFLVAGTRRVALLQRRLAALLRGVAGIRLVELPFEAVPLVEAFWWHPVHRGDPSHAWLRGLLRKVASELPGQEVPTKE